jgi:eukaryotic-like serine/threonine-protein kinase
VTLAAGSRLGPYEILGAIGAGGMGEVYKARDPRLGRDVAIKVLPGSLSSDPDRLKRFEQEARAAGILNHPNITAVYDIGTNQSDGAPYVVQELLEGETLRSELAGGRFAPRKAIDYAVQIAQGLAAAHEKGIVHRDLKPENLFVTKDGRVKILDFGLAKLTQVEGVSAATNLPTATEPGVVMGTLGYMSPEQVKAKPADARSDIFAFGAILYEMLSGQRAFHGDSAGETMASILKEDPPDLSVTNQSISPGLERIVRHCLEKNPERRFQSASDIAFNLESLSVTPSGVDAVRSVSQGRRGRKVGRGAAAGAALALLVAGLLAGLWIAGGRSRTFPTYRRLTFRRGFVSNARFAPDGQTIVYSAEWDGAPPQVFVTRTEGRESTALPLPKAVLLSVSSQGEIAMLLDPTIEYNLYIRQGTLGVVPLSGGSPREVLRDVRHADWSPDGKELAVVHKVGARQQLEYPVGRTVHETSSWILYPRVSPRGDRIAFWEGLPFNGYKLMTLETASRAARPGPARDDFWGFAWFPTGDEILYPSITSGEAETPLVARDLSGRERTVEGGTNASDVLDVSRDGKALVAFFENLEWNRGVLAGRTSESSLLGRTDLRLVDISSDGEIEVLRDQTSFGPLGGVWIARADGSPAVQLGHGIANGISADGAWVLVSQQGKLLALPTSAGASKTISDGFFEAIRWASWFRDGKRVLVWGRAKDATGIFVVEAEGREPRRVAPEGYELVSAGNAVSPDGRLVAARSPDNRMMLCPVDGGEPRPIPGLTGLYVPVQWSSDGQAIFVFRLGEMPAKILKVDVRTGVATPWKELAPPDLAGMALRSLAITPDAKYYGYSCQQGVNNLYLVENLESWRRPTFWSRLLGHSR